MKTIICLAAVLSASLAAVISGREPGKPSFCKEHDCPKYTVISSNDKYEERRYDMSYWVSTDIPASDYKEDEVQSNKAFWKLFGYISGENDDQTKMPMTAPVLKYLQKDKVTMAFMIPHNMGGHAPQPTDSSVTLYPATPQTVYVKAYRGDKETSGSPYEGMVNRLKDELAADGIRVNVDTYYAAGYDGPSVRSTEKYHEIWLAKP